MYLFSSDQRSQTLLGGVSTWLVDHLGIRRVVDFVNNVWPFREDLQMPAHNCASLSKNVFISLLGDEEDP